MLSDIFKSSKEKSDSANIKRLIERSSPRRDFFLMVVLSVAMASFGILMNSTVILIGSMLIAPMLYPILTVGLGFVLVDLNLIIRSLYTLIKAVIYAIIVSFAIGVYFPEVNTGQGSLILAFGNSEVIAMSAFVAFVAGFAATYAIIKPELGEALPGVAISASLVPPLAAAGIAVSRFYWEVVESSLLIFFVNVAGIVFSGLLVYSLSGFAENKKVVQSEVSKDDKLLAEEKSA